MKRSLNEIEVTARRGAAGAGLPYGLAQDVSAAVAWLTARGLDGAGYLAALLDDAGSSPAIGESRDGKIIFEDGRVEMCGASAIDLALSEPEDCEVIVQNANSPLLLAGLAGTAAIQHGLTFCLNCKGSSLSIGPDTDEIDPSGFLPGCDVTLSCRSTHETAKGATPPDLSGFEVDAAAWNKIVAYAHKTYVPASEASRLTGAGAGLTDND